MNRENLTAHNLCNLSHIIHMLLEVSAHPRDMAYNTVLIFARQMC